MALSQGNIASQTFNPGNYNNLQELPAYPNLAIEF
jgi:hypothetical protein